jgi:hypothetical protein
MEKPENPAPQENAGADSKAHWCSTERQCTKIQMEEISFVRVCTCRPEYPPCQSPAEPEWTKLKPENPHTLLRSKPAP